MLSPGRTRTVWPSWIVYAMYAMADMLAMKDPMGAMEMGMDNLYFEAAGTILTLVTVGKYLETRSKSRTGGAIEKLIDLAPKRATVVLDDGTEHEVAVRHERVHGGGAVQGGLPAVHEVSAVGENDGHGEQQQGERERHGVHVVGEHGG